MLSFTQLSDQLLQRYLSNDELGSWMDDFVARCGNMSRKFSIGQSVRGATIWVLEISDKRGAEEPEPNFQYVANMHGNEPSGRMLLPMLAEWLCAHNGKDDRATRLVRDTHLFLMPTMNPDGFARHTRHNAGRKDLNRNFPDWIKNSGSDLRQPLASTQPEVKAVMEFTLTRTWAGSANLHEGALVVVYPYDGYSSGSWSVMHKPSVSPDDATYAFLANTYAKSHRTLLQSKIFKGGVINGAAWYPIYGGIADWQYVAAGCMGVTIEASRRKTPSPARFPGLWEDHRDALLALPLAAALGGVRGRVTVAGSGAPLAATLYTRSSSGGGSGGGGGGQQGDPVPFYSGRAFGEYARPLAPGRHVVTATAEGYQPAEAEVEVPEVGAGAILDFELKPVVAGG